MITTRIQAERGGDPIKSAATRVGLTREQYVERLAAGDKWCTACKAWHPRAAFAPDASRGDGLAARCAASRRKREI